jgi:sulfate-transporting ATPase
MKAKEQKEKEQKTVRKEENLQKKGKGLCGKVVLTCKNLSKSLPDGRALFTNITLGLYERSKIGILGPNGVGKSSLMKVIAGLDKEYEGQVMVPGGIRIGYLPQEPELDPSKNVRENIYEGVIDKLALLERLDKLNQLVKEGRATSAEISARNELDRKAEKLGVKDLQWKIERAMNALRCPPPDSPVTSLSGGERRRVALCRLLCSQPDLLLLDEPTNHLDADSVAWLERFLSEYKGTVMAVTHDRYFLDNVAGWILELDRGRCFAHEGNYSSWLLAQEKRLELEEKKEVALAKQIKKELEWINSTPRARVTKNKARIKAYEQMLNEARLRPPSPGTIFIPPGPRLGAVVIEGKHLRKKMGDRVLIDDFSFALPPGSIVGIIGPNGAGKTTLLNMIAGEDTDYEGTLNLGSTVKLGFVPQHRQFTGSHTIIDEISEGQEFITLENGNKVHIRQYIAAFRFLNVSQEKTMDVLSGGERNRVHLAKMLKRGYNVLLLDEPTNDLDVDVLRNLENAIQHFAGCVVVVTHDRWFLDRICTDIIAFEGDGRVVYFPGNYGLYIEKKEQAGVQAKAPKYVRLG